MKKSIQIPIAVLLVAVTFIACKKDAKTLGVDVQPANDALNAQMDNSAMVYAYTKKSDSTGSFNTALKFLGAKNDPIFGKTEVGLYLNANLTGVDLNFGSTAAIKSAEIILVRDISSRVGDVYSQLSYSVYSIDSELSPTNLYYTSNNRLHRETGLINTALVKAVTINGKDIIKIPIDSTFASGILKNTEALKSNEAFQKIYKGFYIKCGMVSGEPEGVIYKLNLDNDTSGLYLRYYPDAANTSSVNAYRFTFNGSSAARFNTLNYDHSTARSDLKAQLAGDTTSGSEIVYLKGMGSTRIRVLIPSLKSYADSFKVAVNRAELIFNVHSDFLSNVANYPIPPKLCLLAVDSLGREQYTLDQSNTTDLARYDGGIDTDKFRYVFNISRHVQAVMSGKRKNYGFYLVMADPEPPYPQTRDAFIERIGFYGGAKTTLKPITFSLSYIKFPKD